MTNKYSSHGKECDNKHSECHEGKNGSCERKEKCQDECHNKCNDSKNGSCDSKCKDDRRHGECKESMKDTLGGNVHKP